MDSHLSLLKDIRNTLVAIFILIIIVSICLKLHFDIFENKLDVTVSKLENKYIKNKEEIKTFIDENKLMLEKKNGKYTFNIVEEEKEYVE